MHAGNMQDHIQHLLQAINTNIAMLPNTLPSKKPAQRSQQTNQQGYLPHLLADKSQHRVYVSWLLPAVFIFCIYN
ncbi:hypothetical protein [Shewanella violacea]|uniref:Uncharacterized protein n=1 Tax=Shewanella violacea (strain JCM 10179 / CIP 106290 / LMG 19151 / DSS12) TaxID=637905 RepID=D4ZD68_SHEVD|nr:hypothetical protein [Shewanella violacea]BAI99989.1 hypothetical protein SVI_0019 [Shewanella violacea DSS12]